MALNIFGQQIQLGNSAAHAQVVIDTAVLVWTQMGLTAAEIEYGIAMMNGESGYGPQADNQQVGTIRGLGQMRSDVWDAAAKALNARLDLTPNFAEYQSTSTRIFTNIFDKDHPTRPIWNKLDNYNTNAVAGESNDSGAHAYDPQGLVAQLEINAILIKKEYADAQTLDANAAAAAYLSGGVANAQELIGNSQSAISARAYLEHHEGSGWMQLGGRVIRDKNGKVVKVTANLTAGFIATFRKHPGDVPKVIDQVVKGVNAEVQYAAAHGGTFSFYQQDPWTLATADPSLNELAGGFAYIPHDIPSVIPTGQFGFSQTIGALSSFSATLSSRSGVTDKSPIIETYAFATSGSNSYTGANTPWVLSGSAKYNFSAHTGSGTEVLSNGEVLSYTIQEGPNTSTLHRTFALPNAGTLLETNITRHRSGSTGEESEVDYGATGVATGGQLTYFNYANESERVGIYNEQSRLTGIIYSTAFGGSTSVQVGDNGITAEQLAAKYNLPVTDPAIINGSLRLKFDYDGASTVTDAKTGDQGSANPDPVVTSEGTDSSGNHVSWAFSLQGMLQSRTLTAQDGSTRSVDFEQSGNISGSSTSAYQADGSVLVTKRSPTGQVIGLQSIAATDDDVSITINGTVTEYPVGCTVITNYSVDAEGHSTPVELSIKSNGVLDGNRSQSIEQRYSVISDGNGAPSYQYIGQTVTTTSFDTNTSVSIDYDAYGIVEQTRNLATSDTGITTIQIFDAAGEAQGSSRMSLDDSGSITVDTYDALGVLQDQKVMTSDCTLTDTNFSASAPLVTSYSQLDDGSFRIDTSQANGTTQRQLTLDSGLSGNVTISADHTFFGSFTASNGTQRATSGDGLGNVTAILTDPAKNVVGTVDTSRAPNGFQSSFSSSTGTRGKIMVNTDGNIQLRNDSVAAPISLQCASDGTFVESADDGSDDELYDASGNYSGFRTTVMLPDGSTQMDDFDSDGLLQSRKVVVVAPNSTTIQYYDMSGDNPLETGYSVAKTDANQVTTTEYYSLASGAAVKTSYTIASISPAGLVTVSEFDKSDDTSDNFQLSNVQKINSDDAGNVEIYSYGASGTLLGYKVVGFNSAGNCLASSFGPDGTISSAVEVSDAGSAAITTHSGTAVQQQIWGSDGSTATISDDGEGNRDFYQVDPAGKETNTWGRADGSSGVTNFNSDGSEFGTQTNADGTVGTFDYDASGNGQEQTYSGGILVGDSWYHADGTAGSDSIASDGSSMQSSTDAEGITTLTLKDAAGNTTTTVASSDGTKISDGWAHVDSSSFNETYAADGTTVTGSVLRASDGATTTITDDGVGDASTTVANVAGMVTSGHWTNANGSHGTVQLVAGVETDTTFAVDGSYRVSTSDVAGDTSWATYDPNGTLTGGAYSNADGTYGDTSFEPDGTSITHNHNRDGSFNQVTTQASGDSSTTYFSADGTSLSTSTTIGGVTTVVTVGDAATSNFEKHGTFARATSDGHGSLTIALYSGSGVELTEFNVYSPDQNAGYGGYGGGYGGYGGGPNYTTYDISQTTFLGNGTEEIQNPYAIQRNGNSPLSQVGYTYRLQEEYSNATGDSLPSFGQPHSNVVASTTKTSSHPVVTPSTLQLTQIDATHTGISTNGGPLLYVYDGTDVSTTDLSGNPVAVAAYNVTGLPGALNYVAAILNNTDVETTYVDGSKATYRTNQGVIVDSTFQDLAGDYTHYTSNYPAGYSSYAQTTYARNAAGATYSSVESGGTASTIIANADGSIAEWDRGSTSQFGSQYDVLHDPYGNTITTSASYSAAQDVSVDSLGDVITSDFASMGTYGSESVSTSWTESDGTKVSATFNLSNGTGVEHINYTDGTYSVVQNDAYGNSAGTDYNAQGVAMGDEWAHNDGSYGSDSTKADGSYLEKWTSADGSKGAATIDASTGENVGSSTNADGTLLSTWDNTNLSNGQVESKAQTYAADGSVTSTDTITQSNGSYSQAWTMTDGTSGTNVWNATTGENSGTKVTSGGGEVDTWDNIPLANGAVESTTSTTYADGTGTTYYTTTQADGSFEQTFTSTDGSHGSNSLDAATGETTGSTATVGSGVVVSWDRVTQSDGALAQTASYVYDDGSSVSVDSTNYVDGASAQTWRKSDGEAGSGFVGAQSGNSDVFQWGSGFGSGTLQTFDGNDKLAIAPGVADDQLWFTQNGNDLDISILGTNDTLAVQNWYSGSTQQVQDIELSNGETLFRADVQKLVDAMAAFAPPDSGQIEFTPAERNALTPVLAANWH